jgi:hypothetical protein
MLRNRFSKGRKLKTIYLRVPVELADQLQAFADRPPDGGAPLSLNHLCVMLIRGFLKSVVWQDLDLRWREFELRGPAWRGNGRNRAGRSL